MQEVTFRKGEYCLLEAASGTGKTSLCHFLYGIREDYAGGYSSTGADCRGFSAAAWSGLRRRSLSMLFQDLRLFGELTVAENIGLKNELTHFKTQEQIGRMLEAAGIADKRDAPVEKLSFGQQQRVAFIRCMCQPFDFILLDEPVSHLDAANGELLSGMLLEEAQAQGAGIVVTSVGSRLGFPTIKTPYAMTLLWKLLRSHLSVAQTVGFALAGVVGMTIVLTSVQAYRDVMPVFDAPDSFMRGDYLVLSKRVGALQTIGLGSSDFTPAELEELKGQPFVRDVGAFTPADYRVKGTVGMGGVQLSTYLFFEAVPDRFLDVTSGKWKYEPGDGDIPHHHPAQLPEPL